MIHDVADKSIVAGNPAKKIGDNMERKVFRKKISKNGGRIRSYSTEISDTLSVKWILQVA